MQLSRIFLITFAAAAVVIAVLVWSGFESTKGNHLVPTGKIGRVRTQKIEDDVAIAVLDFKIRNDSDRDMIVRSSQAQVEMPDGSTVDGSNASESDAPKLFQAYPLLGVQFQSGAEGTGYHPTASGTESNGYRPVRHSLGTHGKTEEH